MEITKRKYFLLSLFLSFSIAAFVQFRAIFDDTAINSGVRNQIYWMARLMDPSLFPSDLIADHFAQPKMISPILAVIYNILPKNIEPNEITQLIPLILVIVSTIFLFKAAEIRFDCKYVFWLCFGFNMSIWMIDNLAGGLQRSFFYPLFFFFLWMFAKRAWLAVFLALLIQAFIYPLVFIISLAILFLDLIYKKLIQENISKTHIVRSTDDANAKTGTPQQWLITSSGTAFGILVIYIRYLFFTDTLISGYLHEELLLKHYLVYISPTVIMIIATRFLYELEISLTEDNSIIVNKLSPWAKHFFKHNTRTILIVFILFMSFNFWHDNLIKISKNEYKIYKFIKSTAKDSLILAPLNIADNIPALSYRSVLINSTATMPVGKKYSLAMKERLKDAESIYSAHDIQALSAL
ncbi:MAG: hypothetical protein ACKO3R_07605, partial [bacterium]